MKKATIKEAVEFYGLVKVGRYYFDPIYADNYMDIQPFGIEQVYLTDGVYADNEPSTGKEVLEQYIEYMEENPEEFVERNKKR
jgi:hypothetical protein